MVAKNQITIQIFLFFSDENMGNYLYCKKSDEEKIIGTWVITELFEGNTITITYIFLVNNTYIVKSNYLDNISIFNGTWKIVDNKLVVTIEGRTQTGNYKFSDNDKTLTITDIMSNTTKVLTKQ